MECSLSRIKEVCVTYAAVDWVVAGAFWLVVLLLQDVAPFHMPIPDINDPRISFPLKVRDSTQGVLVDSCFLRKADTCCVCSCARLKRYQRHCLRCLPF
jgi:hypothetical protein